MSKSSLPQVPEEGLKCYEPNACAKYTLLSGTKVVQVRETGKLKCFSQSYIFQCLVLELCSGLDIKQVKEK